MLSKRRLSTTMRTVCGSRRGSRSNCMSCMSSPANMEASQPSELSSVVEDVRPRLGHHSSLSSENELSLSPPSAVRTDPAARCGTPSTSSRGLLGLGTSLAGEAGGDARRPCFGVGAASSCGAACRCNGRGDCAVASAAGGRAPSTSVRGLRGLGTSLAGEAGGDARRPCFGVGAASSCGAACSRNGRGDCAVASAAGGRAPGECSRDARPIGSTGDGASTLTGTA
mmetsp:Transcript_47556/g.152798  ORF Transcript_47556/g.152798 Transcript_47556/m.152798 type:complete len:226 (-) Transcript_47556:360-1037(-)